MVESGYIIFPQNNGTRFDIIVQNNSFEKNVANDVTTRAVDSVKQQVAEYVEILEDYPGISRDEINITIDISDVNGQGLDYPNSGTYSDDNFGFQVELDKAEKDSLAFLDLDDWRPRMTELHIDGETFEGLVRQVTIRQVNKDREYEADIQFSRIKSE